MSTSIKIPYSILAVTTPWKDQQSGTVRALSSYSASEVQHYQQLTSQIDYTKREQYLLDEEFIAVFNMSVIEFKKLPRWKQMSLKQEYDLF